MRVFSNLIIGVFAAAIVIPAVVVVATAITPASIATNHYATENNIRRLKARLSSEPSFEDSMLPHPWLFEHEIHIAYFNKDQRASITQKRIDYNRNVLWFLDHADHALQRGLTTSQEDELFMRLYPLVEGYIKSAFANGIIRLPLNYLALSVLGEPKVDQSTIPDFDPQRVCVQSPERVKFLNTLKPMLATLSKTRFLMPMDDLDDAMLEAFYPLLYHAQKGNSGPLIRTGRYFRSERFSDALYRHRHLFLPAPYLDLANGVMHLMETSDRKTYVPFESNGPDIERAWKRYMMHEFPRTLVNYIVLPLARSHSLPWIREVHEMLTEKSDLAYPEVLMGLLTTVQYGRPQLALGYLEYLKRENRAFPKIRYCIEQTGWQPAFSWLQAHWKVEAEPTRYCRELLFEYSAVFLGDSGRLMVRLFFLTDIPPA
ncbi:hypothetical protein H4R33_003871 [Dimargaris cristalligena]|nr:hypothetical protein H4R33_003871 [Dimargaris cristalligena]